MGGTPAGVRLSRTDENAAQIDALARAVGGRVALPTLLGDLNRRARRGWAPGLAVRRALTWDAADRRDLGWWPQGITSSAEAGRSDVPPLLLVSWYSKRQEGARISVLDLDTRRYRHVLLVQPTLEDGVPGVAPLSVHAGGIVWDGEHLHVAATGRGFHTCRIDDLLRVPDGSPLAASGYRYLLPVRYSYRAVPEEGADEGVERLRFSFLSLDRETSPPALVVGEYGNRSQTRRLARFAVDPETQTLGVDPDGFSRPDLAAEALPPRSQGVVVAAGRHYVTTSHGPATPGSVHVGGPGALRRFRWAAPMGPEDLTWWPETDLLWSVTEHPHKRWIYAMPRTWFDR
ncbi:hypothetical protein [Nocardioides pantholopis]|uniref:hypothetical protein n=1 Tax=Nocardioides pantholopis TaxID=2483798 RepID=UPI000FD7A260|nr:hypothetical protein [Nocardioides pantholopis]